MNAMFSKNYFLFILLIAMLTLNFKRATATNRTIRENVTWEYTRPNSQYHDVIQLQIKGDTIIENISYKLLTVILNLGVGKNSSIGFLDHRTKYNPSPVPIREENRRIYIWRDTIYYFPSTLLDEEERVILYPAQDTLVMDFNVEKGDEILLPIDNATELGIKSCPSGLPNDGTKYNLTVSNVGTRMIRGEECKVVSLVPPERSRFNIHDYWYPHMIEETPEENVQSWIDAYDYYLENGFPLNLDGFFKVVEGLGPVYEENKGQCVGTIAMLEGYEPQTSTGPTNCLKLNRVFDLTGDIYRSPDYIDFRKYIDEFSSINSIYEDNNYTDEKTKYFNLQGQRIAEPKPGDVVIRVCGDRREKIVMP